jgi:predicted HAD superfamily hydrolase
VMAEMKSTAIDSSAYEDIIRNVVSPFLVTFLSWVITSALNNDIKRLYFVSRDGQLLYKLANKYFCDHGIEFSYLYGSRQAWYPFSIDCENLDQLDWLVGRGVSAAPRDILSRVNIIPEDYEVELSSYGYPKESWNKQLEERTFNEFLRFLKSEQFKVNLRKRIETQKKYASDYFREQGLFSGVKWAIVDTGWTLRSQMSLNTLLVENMCPQEAMGFYMGVRRDHVQSKKIGECKAFLMESSEIGFEPFQKAPWFFKQGVAAVIEEVFVMSDQYPVVGYEKDSSGMAVPVINKSAASNASLEIATEHQNKVLLAAETELLKDEVEWQKTANQALKKLQRFLDSPTSDEVSAIAWVTLKIDQTHEDRHDRKLASPLTVVDLFNLAWHVILKRHSYFHPVKHGWYRGCIAISPFWVKWIYYFAKKAQLIK